MGLYYQPQASEVDTSGDTLAGGRLNFFETGTSTPKNTFSDKAMTIPHSNPVIADAAGRWDPIYTDGSYKIVLEDTDQTEIWSEDDINFGGTEAYNGVDSITATTSIDATRENKHLRVTNTVTLNLLAVTSAADGFMFSLRNDGTGLVTINPNSSEQINDSTTIVLAPGDGGDVICDGTEWSYTGNQALKQWNKGADKASATALDISAVDGNYWDVTGTTTITSITTTGFIGSVIKLHFDGILTFTNDGDNLILQGGANITTAAGDEVELIEYASGKYRQTGYLSGGGTSTNSGINKFTGTNSYSAVSTHTATVVWSKGADVASATALPVLTDGNYFDVTGTTAITTIDTLGVGTVIKLHFDGILILTHDATNLILPGGVNITTAAGDEAEFVEYATGDWRCTNYSKADGTAVIKTDSITPGTPQTTTSGTAFDFTGIPAGTKSITINLADVSLSGSDQMLVQIGDAGGIETSGYKSSSRRATGNTGSTSGFIVRNNSAAIEANGTMILTLMNSSTNKWAELHAFGQDSNNEPMTGGGRKALSAELTQLRLTRTGSNTFDAGEVNITFE